MIIHLEMRGYLNR